MGSVRVPYLLEPELNLPNLNLWSSSRFSKFPGPNPRFGSQFSKILQELDRPGLRHHYTRGGGGGGAACRVCGLAALHISSFICLGILLCTSAVFVSFEVLAVLRNQDLSVAAKVTSHWTRTNILLVYPLTLHHMLFLPPNTY